MDQEKVDAIIAAGALESWTEKGVKVGGDCEIAQGHVAIGCDHALGEWVSVVLNHGIASCQKGRYAISVSNSMSASQSLKVGGVAVSYGHATSRPWVPVWEKGVAQTDCEGTSLIQSEGVAISGDHGVSRSLRRGIAISGRWGVSIGDYTSKVAAGVMGALVLQNYDGGNTVLRIGEDFFIRERDKREAQVACIQPNRLYGWDWNTQTAYINATALLDHGPIDPYIKGCEEFSATLLSNAAKRSAEEQRRQRRRKSGK